MLYRKDEYKKYLFHFGYWLLFRTISDCPKKCFVELRGSRTHLHPRLERLCFRLNYALSNRSEGDVHASDDASATVLRFSCDQLRNSRLAFVINHRTETLRHWIYMNVIGFLMAELASAQERLIITPTSRAVVWRILSVL